MKFIFGGTVGGTIKNNLNKTFKIHEFGCVCRTLVGHHLFNEPTQHYQ
jgi:hypothetical protein